MMDELLKKKIDSGREYRSLSLEVRKRETEQDDFIVEGYATTFNQEYCLYNTKEYSLYEQIAPQAFNDCDMNDVIFQYDHVGRVYARTKNETLELLIDDKGLFVRANLGGTEEGRKLYQEIKNGYVDKMSFGFVVENDEVLHFEDLDEEKTKIVRTITKISKLYDVSAVSIPANDTTSITARNLFNGEIEKIKMEYREKAVKKLKLKLKLLEI